jgi:hypothetical protein
MKKRDTSGRNQTMPSNEQQSPFSGTGEPRSTDVAITVLTALILLFVLGIVAILV